MNYYKKPNFVDWEMSAEEQQLAAQQKEIKAQKAADKLDKLIDKAESLVGRAEFHEMISAFIYWNRYVADYKNPVEYPKYKLPELSILAASAPPSVKAIVSAAGKKIPVLVSPEVVIAGVPAEPA